RAGGKQLLQSYARYAMRLPYPKHPEYKARSVRIYRVQHRILGAPELASGADPLDLTTFLPYYQGRFDAEGKLLDPEDPFLYWHVPTLYYRDLPPVLRDGKADRAVPRPGEAAPDTVLVYAFRHAGDEKNWIIPPKRRGP